MTFQPEFRDQKYGSIGEVLLQKNQVAAILLAGGQGTRLGTNFCSKGFFPVSLVENKTLFQIFAEKTKAASLKYGKRLRLVVMTSPFNHEPIVSFFREHHLFGLEESQLFFFKQSELPFLDDTGSELAVKGPSGNAAALRDLFASGLGDHLKELGVQYLTTVLVDNPLADPFPRELIGLHELKQAEISALTVEHLGPHEKVGRYIADGGKVKVVEYMELADELKGKNSWANLSLFCFSMSFASAHHAAPLPIHKVRKETQIGDQKTFAWKQESFIFDYLDYARSFHALAYPRSLCFAPLKNSSGDDSIETVQAALQKRDRILWRELFSVDPDETVFELSPRFYYPNEELLVHYKGKKPVGYVG